MSWNNVIPFWVILAETEELYARMQCAFDGEINSGWMYSTPPEISTPLNTYEYTEEELDALMERNRKKSQEAAVKYEGEW